MATLKKLACLIKNWLSRTNDFDLERFERLESKKYQTRGDSHENYYNKY